MKTEGLAQSIRRVLGALLFCCVLLCGAALAEAYPESDHPYADNLDQTWTYTHFREVEYLDVTFSENTEFENNYDKLIIEGVGHLGVSYTGTELAGKTVRVYSSSFTLHLKTNHSTNKYGFKITQIADPDFVFENGVLTKYHGAGGVVTVPNGVTTIGASAFRQCFNVTKVILPNTVTSIEDEAFYDCSGMTSIEWSNQLRTIGVDAFRGCALKSIILPDSVTTIGSEAFSYCRQATELKLPAGLTTIKSYAFHYCSSLTEVVLPDTVTSVGIYAFGQCSALTSITMPDALASIGINAFYQCTSLKECFLPDKITTIGKGAFDAATTLYCNPGTTTETTLKNAGISYEYPSLFNWIDNGDGTCTITGYTGTSANVTIPSEIDGLKVTAIGDNAFVNNRTITSVIIPEGVTSIGRSAFWECRNLQSVSLPDTLQVIETDAFGLCMSLAELTIPANVTYIDTAFYNMPTIITVEEGNTAYVVVDDVLYTADRKTLKFCPQTKNGVFAIPEGTKTIDYLAFFGCWDLTEIRIPASVQTIFSDVFGQTISLTGFVVDEDNTAYKTVDGMLLSKDGKSLITVPMTFSGTVTVPDGVEQIWQGALSGGWPGITELILPDSLLRIENYAIGHSTLEKINLPASLTEIRDDAIYKAGDQLVATVYENTYAHEWCVDNDITVEVLAFPFTWTEHSDGTCTITGYTGTATDVRIPSVINGLEVTAIGENAFADNRTITSVIIPEGVTSIERNAFWQCLNLQSVSLPSTLKTIEDYAFCWCMNLGELTIPASVTEIGWAFFGMSADITVESDSESFAVVDGVLYSKDLKTLKHCPADREGVFAIPEGTEVIDGRAFCGCHYLTEIRIPASVKDVSKTPFSGAFASMSSLERFVVDEANTEYQVVNSALLANDGRELISVPASVTGSYTVPESVKAIRTFAFEGGYGEDITEVVLPDSVVYIQHQAFCDLELEKINLPAGMTQIDDEAFSNCGSFTATVYENTYAHRWCVENGLAVDVLPYDPSAVVLSVAAGRLDWNPDVYPLGISLEVTRVDGGLSMLCNDDATDWDRVVTSAEELTDKATLWYVVQMYDDAASCRYVLCDEADEESLALLETANAVELGDYKGLYLPVSYAEYDAENGVITPVSSEMTVLLQQLDEAGEVLVTESFAMSFGHTRNKTYPAEIDWFDMSTAIPNYHGLEGVSSRVEDNTLIYAVQQDFADLISTSYPAPEGTAAWTCAYFGLDGRFDLRDGAGYWAINMDVVALPYQENVAVVWLDENDIIIGCERISVRYEREAETLTIQPMPASRISDQGIPYGLEVDVEITDGSIHAVFDDENTNWNDVFTFLEPRKWHDSITGESGVDYEPRFGAYFYVPEGAVYAKVAVGEIWESDEEILTYLRDTAQTENLTQGMRFGYWYRPATLDNGTVTLHEVGVEHPFVHVIQWLDEEQNVIATEKATIRFEHTNPDKTYPSTRTLIPAESIIANAENASGVTVEVADGSVSYTQSAADTVIVTEIIAPEGAVAYSAPGETFDPDAERWPVTDGKIGYVREGALTDPVTAWDFICWYDADDQLLGGGWIDFRYERAETLTIQPMPANRISDQGIPYGLEVDVEITDGSIHAVFDDENTNWNDVFTFLEPRKWHDSITGESGVDYEPRFGAYFYVPEGASYAKVAVGDHWESDEEILAYLRDEAETENLTQGLRFGWYYSPATLRDGIVWLNEQGVESPFVHVIQWLDEEQNVIATEKATIRFEHTNPDKTYTATRTLIPAESIIANAENASGVTVEVADGSVSYTQSAENTVIVTEIIAPEGAAAYSTPGETFDPDAERWPVTGGKIGYVREGALNDPVTAWDFICWYNADGQLIGGGWIDFRYEHAEALTIQPIPASRLSFGSFPFGMVAEDKTTDGQAWVVINDEATDWDKVLTFNEAHPWYNPDTGESGYWEPTDVKFYLYISKPEGAAYTGYSPCGGISDEEIIRILTQPDMMEDTSYSMPSWGLDIASYDPETGVFLPIDIGAEDYEGPTTYAVAWADENKNVFLVEKVEVRYEHTSPEGSFPAEYVKLAAEDILPNADQAEGVKSSVADGTVLYTVKQDAKPESIVTFFEAPENAAYYTLTEDFRYAYCDRQPVWNEQAAHTLTLDEPESTTYVLVWLDETGNVLGGGRVSISWEEEAVPVVTLMPAANIRPDGLPFGIAADVTVEDGLFKVVIDDETTDWNDVFTFLDPDEWYNPDTGESGTYAGRVMVGAQMTDHEGAVYSKSIVGNVWETDEELLAYMDEVDEIEDLTSYGHGWWHNIAELDRESSTVILQEVINTPSWTYAVQWLDADQNVLCTEKVVFEITHTNPNKTYTSTRTLIPAESIVGNVENMDGVTCEISDGLIVTTVENKQITTTTEIIAPASAVTYSMSELDTSGEHWDLHNGRVGFQRMGWASAENETSKAYLLCWYDAEGQLIGGGWITMTDVCPIPEMILPAFVKEIQMEAFAGSNVQRVIIPDGCTVIGERAFADCANLSEVHIPDSVTSIADNAFAGSLDVTIYAPAGSEGMRFAGDHDLKWANVSSFH